MLLGDQLDNLRITNLFSSNFSLLQIHIYARIRSKPQPSNQSPKIIIIGAGPAGIAAAGALNHLGISNLVIEKSGRIIILSALCLQLLKSQQVVDYVTGYAHMMQVQINFHESITNVTKKGNNFVVTTKKEDGSQGVYEPKVVIVATGQETVPVIPKFVDQGLFKGVILHSSNYKTAEDFRGKKVLVVGFGNTGGELSIDLYEHGCDVTILARSPVNILKRRALVLAPSIARHLPVWLQLALEWLFIRLDYGDMHKYGITCPIPGIKNLSYYRIRKFHEAPVVDIGQIDLIRENKIKVVKHEIERFTKTGVVFKNGKEETFDVVVLATGFRSSIDQFLSAPLVSSSANELGFPLGLKKLQEKVPGLFFVGFEDEVGRILRMKEDAIAVAEFIQQHYDI